VGRWIIGSLCVKALAGYWKVVSCSAVPEWKRSHDEFLQYTAIHQFEPHCCRDVAFRAAHCSVCSRAAYWAVLVEGSFGTENRNLRYGTSGAQYMVFLNPYFDHKLNLLTRSGVIKRRSRKFLSLLVN